MILPLTHERMTLQRLPWITIVIIALILIIFLLTWRQVSREQSRLRYVVEDLQELRREHPGLNKSRFETAESPGRYEELVAELQRISRDQLLGRFGFVPARQQWADVLSYAFLHAGWIQLIGNMYLLWLCGCNIEDLWGRPVYIVFYLASAAAAASAYAWSAPESETALVGPSGAIASLMGAFLIRLYDTRVRFFYWFGLTYGVFRAPAWIMPPLWLVGQGILAFVFDTIPVTIWAQVGGFFFGAGVALIIKLTRFEEALLAPAIVMKTTLFPQHPKVTSALESMWVRRYREAIAELQSALRDNPDDVDALYLLAESFHGLGKTEEAASAFRRKLRVHLQQTEMDLAAEAYLDMREASRKATLPPREMLCLAGALEEAGRYLEAVEICRRLVESDDELVLKLKASLALADIYLRLDENELALALLESVTPLAEPLSEWKAHIQDKIARVREKVDLDRSSNRDRA